MKLSHCQSCGQPFGGPECPICAPLERIKIKARGVRRDYAKTKAAERAATSHADKSQPKEN